MRLKITPTHTTQAHTTELWGAESDDRVRHHLRGIQLARGRDSVGTMALRGGRLAAERQLFTAWGSAPRSRASDAVGNTAGLPWPGATPAPTLVFAAPVPAALVDATGEPVQLDEEDLLTTDPARFSVPTARMSAAVTAWSAPWPLRQRWWVGAPPRARMQVVTDLGGAWLLVYETNHWFTEGRYD